MNSGNAGPGGGSCSPSRDERLRAKRNLLLFSFGFVPLLAAFLFNLWARPQYQHFPLALAGAGFLIWIRLKEASRPLIPGRAWVATALLTLCFSILFTAAVLWSPWLGCIAALVGGIYLVWMAGGWGLLGSLFPAFVLVATIIPPPLGLDTRVTLFLRAVAVRWSSAILDALGVIHLLSGNVIELPQKKLLVEEACSGINSVLFVLAACLFYTFWRRRSLLVVVLCLGASLGFVVIGNVIRIALGGWFEYYHHINLLSGWAHEFLGLVLLGIYLGLIVSFDEFLQCIPRSEEAAPDIDEAEPDAVPPAQTGQLPPRSAPRLGWVAASLFAVLGLVGFGTGWKFYHRPVGRFVMSSPTALSEKAVFTMPNQLGTWSRVTVESPESHFIRTAGISSRTWQYKSGRLEAGVAFDYPFRGYHDVRECYTGAGWNVAKTERFTDPTGAAPARIEALMRQEPLRYGELWFSTFDEQGRSVEATELQRSFINRWKEPVDAQASTYRVQVLVTGYAPLAAAEHASVTRFFQEAQKLLARQLVLQAGGQP